ncbi:hypothetical protein AK830_g11499 [Neonectria ditissima]|uniref:DAGKc domain-containing protein n=1 Tax=Neonectria ditissima TaxID=78410 RepID=A0A0P7B189_9HYPO|nr:hypothetical protein AK830_g11499 [Neonectria ditissima]
MSSTQSLAHPSEVESVNDVVVIDGNLTWTRAGSSEKVDRDEILFILEAPKTDVPDHEFFICCLKEAPEDEHNPHRLSLFRTTSIPADALQEHIVRELPPHLRHGAGNEVDVIVSTKSGMGSAVRVWEDVLQPLWQFIATHTGEHRAPKTDSHQAETNGPHYRLIVTENAETIRSFSKSLWTSNVQTSGSRTIVLLSGDGGVVDLLNGSDKDSSPAALPLMALLPLGTGNALFHSMHKPLYLNPGPTPLVHGLRTLFQGTPYDLPAFRASFSPGSRIVIFADNVNASSESDVDAQVSREETSVSHLNGAIVASYGFHASIVYESDTPEYRVHGQKRFGMVAQELLKESHPYTAEVAIRRPGSSGFETIPRDAHAYVLTTLVSNLERAFTISPASKPLQETLRLVHFGPVGGERTMEVMMKAYDEGKHVDIEWEDGERVGYEEVDEVKVVILEKDERWRKVCIDGTIVEIPSGGQMSVKILKGGLFKVLASSTLLLE